MIHTSKHHSFFFSRNDPETRSALGVWEYQAKEQSTINATHVWCLFDAFEAFLDPVTVGKLIYSFYKDILAFAFTGPAKALLRCFGRTQRIPLKLVMNLYTSIVYQKSILWIAGKLYQRKSKHPIDPAFTSRNWNTIVNIHDMAIKNGLRNGYKSSPKRAE